MERLSLAAATVLFLISVGYTAFALGAGRHLPHRFNFWMLLGGFLMQGLFLWERGEGLGRCPLTNVFEVLVFLSWSTLLLYLVVGPVYRLSLMGAFAGPLALVLQIGALLVGDRPGRVPAPVMNPWLEMHAALSVIAYGAFGLACVAGIMYFAQDRMLKTRRILPVFYKLPPISDLARVVDRLVLAGLALLGVGIVSGFAVGYLPEGVKLLGAVLVWVLYAGIFIGHRSGVLGGRRLSVVAVYAFVFSMGVFLWITGMTVG